MKVHLLALGVILLASWGIAEGYRVTSAPKDVQTRSRVGS